MEKKLRPLRPRCPRCGNSSFSADPDGRLICDQCQATLSPPGRVCPVCGAPCAPDDRHCPSCGTDLVRECPTCGALNPSIARKCLACGQELEILDSLFARVTGTRAQWLREVREGAPAIKAQEEAASESRLAEMWAAETRRREALAQARAERDRQQRIIIAVTASIVILVIIAILIGLTFVTANLPGTYPSW